ncbi:ABC transporter transmembrane domain-containing protein [Fulvivirgaceae bacterium BMA10]|uniref:ABC transporter transmembrane domain-containing protein n=1 Tax=Splendidivirga corallicola TaxID=3051826 RepID=A0ABT8KWP4_9BACT|nr:ABC transporter transmembrane domain-containing protein [Fulvivirgaceae bacterium BMA10]
MKTYLRILSFARPVRLYLPQYLIFALLGIIFGLANLALVKPLIDVIFDQIPPEEVQKYLNKPEQFSLDPQIIIEWFNHYLVTYMDQYDKSAALTFVCLVVVASVILSNSFIYLSNVLLAKIRARVIRRLRLTVFDKISRLHIGFFSNERKGDLMSRVTNDVQEIEYSVVNTLRIAFKEPATIILYFIVLFYMSTSLTLFTLLLVPIVGGLLSEIVKRLKKKATKSQESLGRILNILDEMLSGMRVVKAFNARDYIIERFDGEIKNYAKINVSMAKKNELASPVSQIIGISFVAVILYYGGSLVLQENAELEASDLVTYLLIFSQVLPSLKEISKSFSGIQRGLASAKRIFETIDTKPAIQNRPNAVEIDRFSEKIEFKNVFFAYEDHDVLKDINVEIENGKTIALVGPSGGGKSTLVDLIPRFYDVTKGAILIDGKDIKDYKISSVRNLMGIVTQESILFNDTVFNNIAFGMPNAKEEDVINAAKIANAHAFIEKMEEGYYTEIGERGTKLSGGQRQRLSIARAILKNPPILILDEATSALDSESEKLVQGALTNLMKNRTSIVIAHRLSTIQHADEILVVREGKIEERGTHDELLDHNGIYSKLIEMQSF